MLPTAGSQQNVVNINAYAGVRADITPVRCAHIRSCELWYIVKRDGEEQLDYFWDCLRKLDLGTYNAAFARAMLPTPAFQRLQQQQLAQDFITQHSGCTLGTRQQANSLVQQAVLASTSSSPNTSIQPAIQPLRCIQQPAIMNSTNQAEISSPVQPDSQAFEEASTSNIPANEWTQDKVRTNQWTYDKQLRCAEVKPCLPQIVREQLNNKFGQAAQPQIHNALRRKGYHIQEKPSHTSGAWFSKSYQTEHGVKFIIMGDPDCLADKGQHVFETKARMRPETMRRSRDSISQKEKLQMLGYAMLTGAPKVSLVQGLECDGQYRDADVTAVLDFSSKCQDRYLKIMSIQDKKSWASDILPSVKAFVTVLTVVMQNNKLQDELLSMCKAKQASWLHSNIAQARSSES